MEKTFNVLCRKDGVYSVVRVKSTSFYDAKKAVEDMCPVQCVSSTFFKLFKRYQKAYKNIKKAGYEAVHEVLEIVPHIDPYVFIIGSYISIEDLEADSVYLYDAGKPMPLYALCEDPLTELVEWVENIVEAL